MTEIVKSQRRVRINIAITTKGVKTWDATVEAVDDNTPDVDLIADTLAESDRLVRLLDARYPTPTGVS